MATLPRRQQRRIIFASDRAYRDRAIENIRTLLAGLPQRAYPTMQELDSAEYDADGNCR